MAHGQLQSPHRPPRQHAQSGRVGHVLVAATGGEGRRAGEGMHHKIAKSWCHVLHAAAAHAWGEEPGTARKAAEPNNQPQSSTLPEDNYLEP